MRTYKQLIIPVLVIFSTLLMALSPKLLALSYTTEISEADLQKRIEALAPITKKHFFTELTLFEPQLDLITENNQVSISTKVKLKLAKHLQTNGKIKIRGQLSYRPESGAFYFKHPVIEELVFDKLPEKNQAKAQLMMQKIVTQILNKMPVYQLKEDKISHSIAKSSLKSLVVKEDRLLVELVLF